jgi:hypothetical protein
LDPGFMKEHGRHDNGGRNSGGFEPDGVVHTARRARSSIANAG